MLIDPLRWQVDAFVDQADVERLRPGANAIFYLEHRMDALRGKVLDVDTTPVSRLDHAMLATRYGGPIPLVAQTQELIPAEPRFRVRVQLDDQLDPQREVRGQVVIEGTRQSLLATGLRNSFAVLIRESGF